MTGLFGGGLILLFTYIHQTVNEMFYIYMFIVLIIGVVVVNVFFVLWIMPLMYKMSPLEEGSLKDKIAKLSQISGYELSQIVIVDASKRTTKINAFFSGFGKTKKVMIFDTMLEKLTEDEICAVIAHEIGHANYNHVSKDIFKTLFSLAIYTVLFYLLATSNIISSNLNITEYFSFIVIIFILLLSPIGVITSTISNTISRKHEYQADAITIEYGYGNEMITTLKNVARENLANLTPHPLYVIMKYNHPHISQRVEVLSEKIKHV
jgi:STE24 endopeptidase